MTNESKNINYLQGDENIIRAITDQLPIGVYRTSIGGKIIYANPALAHMLEYTLEEFYQLSVYDLFANRDDREEEVQSLMTHTEISKSKEILLKTKNGKEIFVKDSVNVIKDHHGKMLYFDGTLEDITERKKASEALKESEARYKILTDITIEGIIMHKDGIIVDANPSAQNMTGYSSEYAVGRNLLEFIHPDYAEFAKSILNTGFTGTFETVLICSDGSSLDVEAEAKDVFVDKYEYKVVAFRDITKKKKIESEILTLSTAVKQSPTSIVITGLDGLIEYVNPKFTQVTGYSYEEAIGKNPNILKTEHTKSEDYKELWETISKGETWTGEFLNKRKDGTNYWELASISPIIDENGNTIKYLAVKEDITERKKTEAALIKSEQELIQANATKNMFFSIIAHDLKGPIGNFIQLLNLLKESFNDISYDEKIDYLNILTGLSQKTNNLLGDLLLWARIQMNTLEFNIEKVNIKTIVKNSVSIVEEKAKEKNIEIILEVEDLYIDVNENSIKTVIRNLLSNSIKFSHKNSKVEVFTQIKVQDNLVQIFVKDNGVGIPKEDIDKLFKIETSFSTYGTNKEKGTGLGLILCKELVHKNNGSIQVESKEGVGSTFCVTLPIKNSSV